MFKFYTYLKIFSSLRLNTIMSKKLLRICNSKLNGTVMKIMHMKKKICRYTNRMYSCYTRKSKAMSLTCIHRASNLSWNWGFQNSAKNLIIQWQQCYLNRRFFASEHGSPLIVCNTFHFSSSSCMWWILIPCFSNSISSGSFAFTSLSGYILLCDLARLRTEPEADFMSVLPTFAKACRLGRRAM